VPTRNARVGASPSYDLLPMEEVTLPMVTAHILFIDAVGYSTLTSSQQAGVFQSLQELVGECSAVVEAGSTDNLVRSPSGDGMALVFFSNCSSPLRCACELADKLAKDGTFRVRMGIHTGDVARMIDINGTASVSGDGINTAQRVMDFGDGGHILMSLEHAKCLQQARDPAANECYDIGIATAKHGRRIHLFNFHRTAAGTPDVPVKVRKDDEWIRPKTLRLGTSGQNILFASLQILGWLLASPFQWRIHVNQIDPRLTPNFSVIDLTGPQIFRNRDLRQLLIQAYVICPVLLALLIWGVLTPLGLNTPWWIGTMWATGLVSSVLLGVGASLVFMCLLTFDAVVQAPIIAIFGYASAANQIALTAVMIWAAVAMSAVFPSPRPPSALREILTALGTFLLVVVIIGIVVALAVGRSPLQVAGIVAVAAFILINVVIGVRWKQWSRGFVFGQALGTLAAAGYFAIVGATGESILLRLQQGISNGIGDAIWWGFAFAIAEKIASARAAIIAGLLLSAFKNVVPTPWSFLPLVALWTTYSILRQRSLAKQQRAIEALATEITAP
jgi:class 3 adenylate cyclase